MKSKTFTLKEYVGEKEYIDIDDPWGYSMDVYTSCASEIVCNVDKLVQLILRGE